MHTPTEYSIWFMDWETLVSTSTFRLVNVTLFRGQLLTCILDRQWDRSLGDRFGTVLTCHPLTDLLVQIYDHSPIGWAIICYVNVGILIPCVVAILWHMGERPILKRIIHHGMGAKTKSENITGYFEPEQNIVDNPA